MHFQKSVFWLEELLPQRQRLLHDLWLAVLLALYHFWQGGIRRPFLLNISAVLPRSLRLQIRLV